MVSVVAASPVLLTGTDLVCLRICIVVRGAGLGERRRPPDARSSLRLRCASHLLIAYLVRCRVLLLL